MSQSINSRTELQWQFRTLTWSQLTTVWWCFRNWNLWLLSISGGKGSWRITTRHYQIQCQFKINAEINVGALVWNLTSFRLIIWYILTKDQMHLRDVRFPYNSFLFINRLECRKCYLDVIIQLNTPLKSFKFFHFFHFKLIFWITICLSI